jgi:hypothetical protein
VRTQPRFSHHIPRIDPRRTVELLRPESLVAARVQPSYSARFEVWLDAIFARDGAFAVIPFIQIEATMLTIRECSAFVWPQGVSLDSARAGAIERALEPWLRALAFSPAIDREELRVFTSDDAIAADIERARVAGFFGAVSVERLYVEAGPYFYAQRFARGKHVGIASPQASYGAAMLARTAASVRADLLDEDLNALARAWYGLDIFGPLDRAHYDVGIGIDAAHCDTHIAAAAGDVAHHEVAVCAPAFPSVASSFDPGDAPVERTFSVSAAPRTGSPRIVPEIPVIGGSAGRIGLVIRDDGLRSPDADTDEAHALAAALNAQGFTASTVLGSAANVADYDLLHAFGYRHARSFVELFERARVAGIPVVWSPHLDDTANEAAWAGFIAHMQSIRPMDDTVRESVDRALQRRLLEIGNGVRRGTPSYEPDALEALFARTGAAIAVDASEEARIRQSFRYAGALRIVPAVLGPEPAFEDVGWLTGNEPYVLMHAQLDARTNATAVVRAVAERGLPCVLAGAVENTDYYQYVLAQAGPATIWLPEERLTPGQIASVYAGARVFVDASWSGNGAFRLARAAAYGASLVVSNALPSAQPWTGCAFLADPASAASISEAIGLAWAQAEDAGARTALRTSERIAPLAMLQATLGAYAEAGAAVSQAVARP